MLADCLVIPAVSEVFFFLFLLEKEDLLWQKSESAPQRDLESLLREFYELRDERGEERFLTLNLSTFIAGGFIRVGDN